MVYLLLLCYRRKWLSRLEFVRFVRALRTPTGSSDWATPAWVQRRLRLSFFWALCRLAREQPFLLAAGTLAAPVAVLALLWRLFWRLSVSTLHLLAGVMA